MDSWKLLLTRVGHNLRLGSMAQRELHISGHGRLTCSETMMQKHNDQKVPETIYLGHLQCSKLTWRALAVCHLVSLCHIAQWWFAVSLFTVFDVWMLLVCHNPSGENSPACIVKRGLVEISSRGREREKCLVGVCGRIKQTWFKQDTGLI